nr:histidine phosphatase family protein [Bacillus pinisoli]
MIRHCKASGQEREAELTEEGRNEALELCDFLTSYPVQRIFSSPYIRAIDTIQPFASKVELEIEMDERLHERIISKGDYPGWYDFLKASFEDFSLSLQDGESSSEAENRVISFLNEIKYLEEEHIVIVSHGNLLTLLLRHFNKSYGFKEWEAMTNPDVFIVHLKTSEVQRIWNASY